MNRRRFLSAIGTGALGATAGCQGLLGGGTGGTPTFEPEGGSSPQGAALTLDELPALSGELTIYLGRGEGGRYKALLDHFETERYPDLSLDVRRNSSAALANTIVAEESGGNSPADVFWSIDAGALGAVASRGLATPLPPLVTSQLSDRFLGKNGRWAGISGRVRSIPYNTDQFDEADLPNDIGAYPRRPRFDGEMGWAPTYGAFQAFVTAMRYLRGRGATRSWLEGMLDSNVSRYPGEFLVTNAVAKGSLGAGFANHYYALRLQQAKPDAPLGLAFTRNDAGALVNASGALVLASSQKRELASTLIAHLLTVEVQRFLAQEGFEYPLIDRVDPPGDLPPLSELEPPNFDLTLLSDVEETLELMRSVGVL